MAILMKIRSSILVATDGRPVRMKKIENNELTRQLMSFVPQVKRLDMTLGSEMSRTSATYSEAG
jgi:hypothetical protein